MSSIFFVFVTILVKQNELNKEIPIELILIAWISDEWWEEILLYHVRCLQFNEISAKLIPKALGTPSDDHSPPNEPRNIRFSTVITHPLPTLISLPLRITGKQKWVLFQGINGHFHFIVKVYTEFTYFYKVVIVLIALAVKLKSLVMF